MPVKKTARTEGNITYNIYIQYILYYIVVEALYYRELFKDFNDGKESWDYNSVVVCFLNISRDLDLVPSTEK